VRAKNQPLGRGLGYVVVEKRITDQSGSSVRDRIGLARVLHHQCCPITGLPERRYYVSRRVYN